MLALRRESFDYVPYYCEENVWRLLARPELAGLETWAVTVFPASQGIHTVDRVALCSQRAGRPRDGLVFWDYHVYAIVRDGLSDFVLDFDTSLPFATPAPRHFAATYPWAVDSGSFPVERRSDPRFEPLFRVMPGRDYVDRFSSDRGHMRLPDGGWTAPPPPWPCPAGVPDKAWPLAKIRSADTEGPGDLLDLPSFGAHFGPL